MNCIEFEAALELQVESRSQPDPAVMEHAAHCPQCRIALQIQQQLDKAITEWQPANVPTGLMGKVLAELNLPAPASELAQIRKDQFPNRVQTETVKVHPRFRHGFSVLVASFTCVMIAVMFLSRIEKQELASRERTSPTTDSLLAQAPLDVSQTLSEVLLDLRTEYHELATETKSAAMEFVNGLPRQIEIPQSPAPEEFSLGSTSSDVSRIWRPIGSRVETALGFLWQSVPSDIPSG